MSYLTKSAEAAIAVTPHDSTNFDKCRALYIGGAGNVVAIVNDTAVTFTGMLAGGIYPIECTRVNDTNTTATNIVALY